MEDIREQDATKKMCPFREDPTTTPYGYFSWSTTSTTLFCMGSRCMAWERTRPNVREVYGKCLRLEKGENK